MFQIGGRSSDGLYDSGNMMSRVRSNRSNLSEGSFRIMKIKLDKSVNSSMFKSDDSHIEKLESSDEEGPDPNPHKCEVIMP